MKYRAILTGVEGLERPVQVFAQHLSTIDDWVAKTLAKYTRERYPNVGIEVWENVETLLIAYTFPVWQPS